MKRKIIKALKILGIVLGAILIVVAGYLIYVFASYSRIEDNQNLTIEGNAELSEATIGEEYTIVTQNFGFGAYVQDYTFFMDGGKESRARSKNSVLQCINQCYDTIKSLNPDLVILQEVDTDSTRSYGVNQKKMFGEKLVGYSEAYAVNYHSAYLMYPILEPHGASNSGIDTYSKFEITSALRRKLPISDSLSKILDLDRCYSISRVETSNGKELVIFNVHLSAYGSNPSVRSSQFEKLFGDMKKEYEAGNYVICGGDFNADFTSTSVSVLNNNSGETYGWTKEFPDDSIPAGFKKCTEYTSGKQEPTARNTDKPYKEGNFVVIVDGFLVSNNIEVTYLENLQTDFVYSDHNPVCMKFVLK